MPAEAFKAELTVPSPPTRLKAKDSIKIPITVKNLGAITWPSQGGPSAVNGVVLSYHWLQKDGTPLVFDGLRTDLPADLAGGASLTLQARVNAPDAPGTYVLEFDMVQEAVSWFKSRGSSTARFDVVVE
jgi:hypothetical protein